jgi:general secretion pathway protein I
MRGSSRGFTLLEVLVAVAILGLGLTIVSSAQTGVFWSYSKATKLSQAPGLLRCKMAEVELKLLRDGYPLLDDEDEGDCCEDSDIEGYSCSWKVQKVELPQMPLGGMIGSGDAGVPSDPSLVGNGELGSVTPSLGNLGPLGALASGNAGLGPGAGMGDIAGMMMGGMGGMGGAGGGGVGSMVIGFVYPELKLMLEASIRKVVVTVHWKEGNNDRELTATQFVTNPQQGGFDPLAATGLDALGGQGAAGASTGAVGGSAAPQAPGGAGGMFGFGGQR